MSYEPDFEDTDEPCPHCGHYTTRRRDCDVMGCEDGYIDDYEDDPFWSLPGELSMCSECHGTGVLCWCPVCGKDPREPAEATK